MQSEYAPGKSFQVDFTLMHAQQRRKACTAKSTLRTYESDSARAPNAATHCGENVTSVGSVSAD